METARRSKEHSKSHHPRSSQSGAGSENDLILRSILSLLTQMSDRIRNLEEDVRELRHYRGSPPRSMMRRNGGARRKSNPCIDLPRKLFSFITNTYLFYLDHYC